ncbi:MAG: hypothetical protein SFW67_36325 [Myxococcaceae bacterium]|nr:hypothetical protein [Myxococcaceae bacterium]
MATRRLASREEDGAHGTRHVTFEERQAKLKDTQAREHRFLEEAIAPSDW